MPYSKTVCHPKDNTMQTERGRVRVKMSENGEKEREKKIKGKNIEK